MYIKIHRARNTVDIAVDHWLITVFFYDFTKRYGIFGKLFSGNIVGPGLGVEYNDAAALARSESERFMEEQRRLRDEARSFIEQRADEKIRDRATAMDKREYDFNEKTKSYYKDLFTMKESWHKVIFIFCCIFLIIEALTSFYFRECCIRAANWIADLERQGWEFVKFGALETAGIAEGISNPAGASIVGVILLILIGLTLFAVCCAGLPALIAAVAVLYVRSPLFDKVSKWIMVGSGILAVSLASEPVSLMAGQNIILWWIIVQIAVPVVRFAVLPLTVAVAEGISEIAHAAADYFDREVGRRIISVVIVAGAVVFGFAFLFGIMPQWYK